MHRAAHETALLTTDPQTGRRTPAPALPTLRLRYANRQLPALWNLRPGGIAQPRVAMALLALITLIGGCLRFYHLTFPALWNDETLVYWRVCGTYGQMLVPLRLDGFPPLHYSLYWLVGHPMPLDAYVTQRLLGGLIGIAIFAVLIAIVGLLIARLIRKSTGPWMTIRILAIAVILGILFARHSEYWLDLIERIPAKLWPAKWSPGRHSIKLTPRVMRTIPAVAGILTIPAMYFFARQMLNRATSLVAAAFTACSAFMLFYSRDGKMYPDAWLFITLNLGCLLWWFRTGKLTAWLGWVAAGCAMVGLHASALTIPGLSLLPLFTQRDFRMKKLGIFALGLVLIFSGPAGYYFKFNLWTERVAEDGWRDSGLGWVGGFFNGSRTGVQHYQYLSSAFLIGYEWAREDYLSTDDRPTYQPIPTALVDIPQTACTEIAVILLLGILPWGLLRRTGPNLDPAPEPPWRVYLWITGIILLGTYAFYCYSVHGFVSPRRWWFEAREWLGKLGLAIVTAVMFTFVTITASHRRHWPHLRGFVQFLLVTALLFGLCMAIFAVCFPLAADAFLNNRAWQSVWTPRYLGVFWPATGLGVAALLMRLPTRAIRIACIIFVLGVNIGMFGVRMTLGTEPPIDIQAHDEWLAQDVDHKPSKIHTFDYIAHGGIAVAESALDAGNGKVSAGRYYLLNDSGWTIPNDPQHRALSPEVFSEFLSYFPQYAFGFNLRQEFNPWLFKRDIAGSPNLERVIIWTRQSPISTDLAVRNDPNRPKDIDDRLLGGQALRFDWMRNQFPPGWKLASEAEYTVHNPWDWRVFGYWVRREYVHQK